MCLGKNTAGASEERVHLTVEEADRFPTRGDNPGNYHYLQTGSCEEKDTPRAKPKSGAPHQKIVGTVAPLALHGPDCK